MLVDDVFVVLCIQWLIINRVFLAFVLKGLYFKGQVKLRVNKSPHDVGFCDRLAAGIVLYALSFLERIGNTTH